MCKVYFVLYGTYILIAKGALWIFMDNDDDVVLCPVKGETHLSTLMERLRARSLHQASWMETVKVLTTSLSAVS